MWQSLKNLYHLLAAALAALFYRFPARKLKLIGVTGTDGKTTTVHLIYHLLRYAGKNVSMISSVKAVIGQKEYDTGFHVTTPDPWALQKYLRRAVEGGSEYMVLEVTSHALDQNRVAFCKFLVGVLTNVTHEHLDYHKTYENYVATKAKLLKMAEIAVVNRDDESFKSLKLKIQNSKLVTYGMEGGAMPSGRQADWTPQKFPFKIALSGEFNEYNTLAAIATVSNLDIDADVIRKGLLTFESPEGRMEIVVKKPFLVMIDFAHTPNALEKVLFTSRFLTSGKIIVVFGCAGERDQKKRPLMGEIAARRADYTVITAEDPRRENLLEIIEQIAQGCLKGGARELSLAAFYVLHSTPAFFKIPDRQEAINLAIQKVARNGDLVVITGKGHEKSMCFGKKEYPWSDHRAVKRALANRK